MHLLKRIICFYLIAGLVSLLSCKPRGPLTPEDAFDRLKDAYSHEDIEAIENLLSRQSRFKILKIIRMISQMDEDQLRALAIRFGITIDRLKNLTIRDYLSLQLVLGKKIGEDILKDVTRYKIIGKDIRGNSAVIQLENGMELNFTKEGPYWKLDIEDL
jgi:hypothetical protein